MALPAQETGKPPVSPEFQLRIHPNPAPGPTVQIDTDNALPKTVQVFDLFGKAILQRRLTGNTLNIHFLSPGVYMVRVVQQGRSTTKKLIVR